MKAADLVTNYGALRVGQIVDVQWYDYVDFLIAPTPAVTARAKAMMAQGARIEGIPGARERASASGQWPAWPPRSISRPIRCS